ncbi:uncharacterized protein LOC144904803 [Branchiostoma floridae x Branchiostoma belcheri]
MDPWEAASIRGHRTEIVQSLRVQDVRSYMIQEGVMDPEHFEDIECERTRALKVERFLDILATRGPRAFPVFLTALEDFGYPHLADMLLRAPTDVDGCLGGVVLLEDTIAKCRENLKKRYLSEYGWIQPIPWNPAFRLHLDEVYTNLAIVEGKRRSVSADCMDKSYSFQEEWLFDDGPSCVLVEGPAGIGKTMLCHKIAYDWAQGTVHSLKKFKLVFLVEMNKISFPSMKDVIVKIIAADEAVDDEVEAIWDFVSSNPEQILVIMDGLDEVRSPHKAKMAESFSKSPLRRAFSLITTRPESNCPLLRSCDKAYILEGHTVETLSKFIKRYFREDRASADGLLQRIRSNTPLSGIALNPLNAVFLCALWEDNQGALPATLTQLYSTLIECLVRRYFERIGQPCSEAELVLADVRNVLVTLGQVAFRGLEENRMVFQEPELEDIPNLIHVGLLAQDTWARRLSQRPWRFLHKTIQEYLTAYYLAESEQGFTVEQFAKVIPNPDMYMVCIYLAGLLKDRAHYFFETWKEVREKSELANNLCLSCLHECAPHGELVEIVLPSFVDDGSFDVTTKLKNRFYNIPTNYLATISTMLHSDQKHSDPFVTSIVVDRWTAASDVPGFRQLLRTIAVCKTLQHISLPLFPVACDLQTMSSVLHTNHSVSSIDLDIPLRCKSMPVHEINMAVSRILSSDSLRKVRLSMFGSSRQKHDRPPSFSEDDLRTLKLGAFLSSLSLTGNTSAALFLHLISVDVGRHKNLAALSLNISESEKDPLCSSLLSSSLETIFKQRGTVNKLLLSYGSASLVVPTILRTTAIRYLILDVSKFPDQDLCDVISALNRSKSMKFVVLFSEVAASQVYANAGKLLQKGPIRAVGLLSRFPHACQSPSHKPGVKRMTLIASDQYVPTSTKGAKMLQIAFEEWFDEITRVDMMAQTDVITAALDTLKFQTCPKLASIGWNHFEVWYKV